MSASLIRRRSCVLSAAVLLVAALALAGCGSVGTKLQPPAAGIQQLTVQSDGSWVAVVRFRNNSYDTSMVVHDIDATLSLDGKSAGPIQMATTLDIPAMGADIASVTFMPDPAGAAALAAARSNAVRYQLKGTLSVGKGDDHKPQAFDLNSSGYLSPVPGVSNIWR